MAADTLYMLACAAQYLEDATVLYHCANCNVRCTSMWRRVGSPPIMVCNPCGLHVKKYGRFRNGATIDDIRGGASAMDAVIPLNPRFLRKRPRMWME